MERCPRCAHRAGPGAFCPWCGGELDAAEADRAPRQDARWLVWTGALTVLVLAGLGVVLLRGGPGAEEARALPAADAVGPGSAAPRPGTADQPDEPASSAGTSEDTAPPQAEAGATEPPRWSDAGPVTTSAPPQVPATAEPGRDVDGDPVSYEASRMLDGELRTAWRMPGDGTGAEVVLTLAEPTRLARVGLVNGYAKTAADGTDWYAANRRVERVRWRFDDGTTLTQDLLAQPRPQLVDVPDVTTRRVRLTLLAVSEPGRAGGRDYTAISEVRLSGRTRG